MAATHIMTPLERNALASAARKLHEHFRGVFGEETIETLLLSSFQELAATAAVPNWLVAGAERFARRGLAALAHAESRGGAAVPEVGIDITAEFPKPWSDEFVLAADVVVTMGCGDACPLMPGKHYEDWELDEPLRQDTGGGPPHQGRNPPPGGRTARAPADPPIARPGPSAPGR